MALQACAHFLSLGYKYQTRRSVVRSSGPKVCLVEPSASLPTCLLTLSPDQATYLSIQTPQLNQTQTNHQAECVNMNCEFPPSILKNLPSDPDHCCFRIGDYYRGCGVRFRGAPHIATKLINWRVSALSRSLLYWRGKGLQLSKLPGE